MAVLLADEPRARFSELIESEVAASRAEQQEKAKADGMAEQRMLVARALRGDTDAFDDIFDRYSGLMLYTAYGIVQDRDSAEDAVQNALIQRGNTSPACAKRERCGPGCCASSSISALASNGGSHDRGCFSLNHFLSRKHFSRLR